MKMSLRYFLQIFDSGLVDLNFFERPSESSDTVEGIKQTNVTADLSSKIAAVSLHTEAEMTVQAKYSARSRESDLDKSSRSMHSCVQSDVH